MKYSIQVHRGRERPRGSESEGDAAAQWLNQGRTKAGDGDAAAQWRKAADRRSQTTGLGFLFVFLSVRFLPFVFVRMGGRKKMKKKILDRDRKEPSVFSNHSVPARNLRKKDLGAVIFGCKHNTINECLSNQLFGLPASHFAYIKNIGQGLVLFLFNYSDRLLHGIFEAASPGQMNLNRYAWVGDEDNTEYTSYPAQVRVRVRLQCQPLSENHYRPIIAANYYENKHFYFELDHDQTNKLISLFTSSSVNVSASSSQIATRWNSLSSSLPVDNAMQDWEEEGSFDHGEQANKKGSSWDAPLSPGMTTLLQPTVGMEILAENLNQTSRLSYASVLSRNNTTTITTATSSLPTGKWSASSKGQSAFEATNDYECGFQASSLSFSVSDVSSKIPQSSQATNCPAKQSVQVYENQRDEVVARNYDGGFDEFPQNQDKSDPWQEDTWEDSLLVATTTDVECVQTWVSHLSPQANATINELPLHQENEDKANFLQANIWEESQPEVDRVQTWVVDSSHGHLNEPSSSQPLDDNPDCKRSLSNETNESNIEEKHEKDGSLDGSLVPNTFEDPSTNIESLVAKLMQEVEVLKQEVAESKLEIRWLKNRLGFSELGSPSIVDPAEVDDQPPNKCCSNFVDSVLIVGGYDGSSWLATLDSYLPSHDVKSSLTPMNFVKKYASAATLNGELYHFGGMGSHTVESFSLTKNQWVSRPPLYWKNIHVAGASIKDKLFVVGGGNGRQCSSEVEYLDLNIGKWLPAQSMQSKRLAPAAAELNNTLYVAGGYDGVSYVSSVERFDPRERAWHTLSSMNTRKGCHSLVVLNEKLYTVGGFDGDKYIPTVESFDARMGSWVDTEPMNVSRGNLGAVAVGEKLYTIGGAKENNEVLDIVECYKEGSCWEIADLKAIGKKSHFSAIVL